MKLNLIFALILSLNAAEVMATPFPQGNEQTGKQFFEDNKCDSCHIGKVGGDGKAIFTRPNRLVHNPQDMVRRMRVCSGAIGKTLTPQNEQDLGAYLNQTYYKFK